MKVLISLKVINSAYGNYPFTERVSVSRKATYILMIIHFLMILLFDYYFTLFIVSDMTSPGVYEIANENSKSATLTALEEGTWTCNQCYRFVVLPMLTHEANSNN